MFRVMLTWVLPVTQTIERQPTQHPPPSDRIKRHLTAHMALARSQWDSNESDLETDTSHLLTGLPCGHAGSQGETRPIAAWFRSECWFRQRLIRTQEPVIIFTFHIKILPRPDNQHCKAVSRSCLRIANCIVRKICNLGHNVGRWGHGWVFPPCVNVPSVECGQHLFTSEGGSRQL